MMNLHHGHITFFRGLWRLVAVGVTLTSSIISSAHGQELGADTQEAMQMSMPVIRVAFFGQTGLALIDTGTSAGITFTGEVPELSSGFEQGLVRVRGTMDSAQTLNAWKRVPVKLDGLGTSTVMAIRNDGLDNIFVDHLSGVKWVIGMEVLETRVLQLGSNNRSSVVGSNERVSSLIDDTSCKITRSKTGCPMVAVELPILGQIPVKIDTGSNGALALDVETINLGLRNGTIQKLPTSSSSQDYFGKHRVHEEFVLKRLKLNKIVFKNVIVSPDREARLGMLLLRHLVCTFDFHSNVATFDIRGENESPIQMSYPAAGWLWKPAVGGIRIENITADGSADRAGIRSGDIIQKINGRRVVEYSLFERYDIFSAAGNDVHLQILRDGKECEATMSLNHPFPFPPEWPPDPPEFDPGRAEGHLLPE
ncbi:MAG: PDZ domain-containing protein [Planctomycetota bacterium]